MDNYQSLKTQYELDYKITNKRFNTIGALRLFIGITIISTIYGYFTTQDGFFLIASALLIAVFLILIKTHGKIAYKRKINKALISINKDEIDFLSKNDLPFDDGSDYINTSHTYSYDLDVFGVKSLFQTLNRTSSYIGQSKLASSLLHKSTNKEILEKQVAIQELTNRVRWRHELSALSKVSEDNKEVYDGLINWSKTSRNKTSFALNVSSYLLPIIFISALIYSNVSEVAGSGNIAFMLFLLNLVVLVLQLKTIKKELFGLSKIDENLKNYSLIIQKIDHSDFNSEKLNRLKSKLSDETGSASYNIRNLSNFFNQLDSINNPIGAIFINGFSLYHIHTLRKLFNWKIKHAHKIKVWLDVIGEMEVLSSMANFSYNNPSFTFPKLNDQQEFYFKDLGHPLIHEKSRVGSDVNFAAQKFIILTGSNMSGKSTFLRSLGVNMILAGAGAAICAKEASIHPLNILVSMRLSDSLSDNESYFFAEVKRLKEIMDKADKETSFILLDEILRGTNSDDKRNGTVEVIKKLISKNAIGAIATHDLKVCDITASYPDQLINKCFEVEVINDELSFDYQLRDGVCKNKSATFLMKKMEVI